MNKPKILAKLLLSVTLWACSTEIEIKDEKQPLKAQKQTKNIHFKGLEVKHRFSMPAKYLDDKTETKFTSQVAQKLYTLSDYRLEDIAEVTEEVFKQFPNPSEDKNFKVDYKMISEDFPKLTAQQIKKNDSLIARYYAINLDYEVLQILKKTKKPIQKKDNNLKQLGASYGTYGYGNPPPTNVNCSGVSFPTNETQFMMNFITPCQYKNFQGSIKPYAYNSREVDCSCVKKEDEKRQAAKEAARLALARKREKNEMKNCTPKRDGSNSNKWGTWFQMNFTSIHAIASGQGVSQTVVSYAIGMAAHYAAANYIQYDAVKHMYWQGLLCKFYYPILHPGSKLFRMDFAKEVGEWYEVLGNNNMDDSEMDLHNNEIGRKIWLNRSWYSGWWIFTVIRSPSRWTLLDEARDAYHGRHTYQGQGPAQAVHEILIPEKNKPKPTTSLGNTYDYDSDKNKNKFDTRINICNRRYWILNNADKNRPVETYKNQLNK